MIPRFLPRIEQQLQEPVILADGRESGCSIGVENNHINLGMQNTTSKQRH
jgi:hypothetical protein